MKKWEKKYINMIKFILIYYKLKKKKNLGSTS